MVELASKLSMCHIYLPFNFYLYNTGGGFVVGNKVVNVELRIVYELLQSRSWTLSVDFFSPFSFVTCQLNISPHRITEKHTSATSHKNVDDMENCESKKN